MLLFAISSRQVNIIVEIFYQRYIQYYVINIKESIGHCLKCHCLKQKSSIHDHTIIPQTYSKFVKTPSNTDENRANNNSLPLARK